MKAEKGKTPRSGSVAGSARSRSVNHQEREKWHGVPEVYVKLMKDTLGYPPKQWEQLKAEPTDSAGVYRPKSIAFYARGPAKKMRCAWGPSLEGYYPAVENVTRRSGYSTMRLWVSRRRDST